MSRHRLALMIKLPDNLIHGLDDNLTGQQSHLSIAMADRPLLKNEYFE